MQASLLLQRHCPAAEHFGQPGLQYRGRSGGGQLQSILFYPLHRGGDPSLQRWQDKVFSTSLNTARERNVLFISIERFFWLPSRSVQVWGHLARGEREEHMGDDPHSLGAPSEGAPGQNHPDHRLLAGQPAVAVLQAIQRCFSGTDQGMWKAEL